MQELFDPELSEDDPDEWAKEFTGPYTGAMSTLLRIKSWRPVSPETISNLTAAENDFWSFICEFELRQDEIAEVFNLYLEQTRILRMNKRINEDEMSDAALKCLGLGLLMLAKMEEIYCIWFGFTWKLDNRR